MDLVLLHAPSVFDFRNESIFYGPISDVVPSTPVFEMYPVGLASIAHYLDEHGYRTRIVNLAYRMVENPRFDALKMIRRLKAPLVGIDLHWLPHAQGSLEVARLVRESHPGTKIVLGGLSSSYFHRELMSYPQVDFVLRGDSTEEPMRLLLKAVKEGGDYESIPNLTWRDATGSVRENPLSHVPDDLDYADFSYRAVLKNVFRYRDLKSVVPFQNWLKYPITMPLQCRGCTENCVICGGSKYAFGRFFGRNRVAFRSPAAYVGDITRLGHMTRAPIFLVGDIRQAGEAYADEVLERLSRSGVENEVIFEFFNPVDRATMRRIARSVPAFSIEISPETHDERIRMAAGKHYTTADFENTLRFAMEEGARKVDIYYMVGIPGQSYASVMETVEYSRHLIRDLHHRRNIYPFISPLAPFLDPGSIAFENPERTGYKVRFRTLEEHRRALLAPSWKHTLNYETAHLTRDEISDATYEAALRLMDVREEQGILDPRTATAQREKISASRRIMADIDRLVAEEGIDSPNIRALARQSIDKARVSTLIDHRELQWLFPGRGIRIRRVLAQRLRWLLSGRA